MSETATRTDNLKSVKELIAERPAVDNTATFAAVRSIQMRMWAKITSRFTDLAMHSATKRFQPYASLDGSAKGELAGYTSSDVEWAVCSWVGNPSQSFCNMHVTVWMKADIDLPHLAFACGTFPVIFFFLDYIPRVEPQLAPDYQQKYMQPANAKYLELMSDKRMMPFVSQNLHVRCAVSPIGLNFIAPPDSPDAVDIFEAAAEEHFDRWIGWSHDTTAIPEDKRTSIAERDLAIRRNTAELDPANAVVEKLYGKELTDGLVRGLWGGL